MRQLTWIIGLLTLVACSAPGPASPPATAQPPAAQSAAATTKPTAGTGQPAAAPTQPAAATSRAAAAAQPATTAAQPATTAAQPASSAPQPATTTAPPASSAPQPAGATAQPAAASGAWDKVVADAHSEGTLVLNNGAGTSGQALLDVFQAKFPWLQLQATTLAASQFAPRVLTEQRNGLYAWDLLLLAGFNTTERTLAPAGAVGDVRPLLADLPADLKDDAKWAGGFAWYRSDSSPDSLVTDLPVTWGVYVNRDFVPESHLSSISQLADPAFKGKLVIYNPTVANAGSQSLANIMAHTDEEFVRKLLVDQAAVQTSDANQAAQFLTEGRYPIALGVSATALPQFTSQGVGKNVEPLREVANQYVRAGGFTVMKNAPHPNAIKVFLSWFLSREAQEEWNKSLPTAASRRLDVTVVNPDAVPDYAHLNDYKVIFDTPPGNVLLDKLITIAASTKT